MLSVIPRSKFNGIHIKMEDDCPQGGDDVRLCLLKSLGAHNLRAIPCVQCKDELKVRSIKKSYFYNWRFWANVMLLKVNFKDFWRKKFAEFYKGLVWCCLKVENFEMTLWKIWNFLECFVKIFGGAGSL